MKRHSAAVIKFVITVLVTLSLFEVYVRTSEISTPSIVMDHERVGRAFRPGADVMLLQEGFFMGRVNAHGYLGPDYPPRKTPGRLRVALVGDSYVEAFQLFDQYSFRAVLERELTDLMDEDVEVLNFGRSGQDLRTMYIYYREVVTRFEPDITVFVISGSDLRGRDKNLGPMCKIDGGELKIDYSFADSDVYQLKLWMRATRKLAAYSMLQAALARYRAGESRAIILDKLDPANFRRDPGRMARVATIENDKYFDLNTAVLEALGRIDQTGGSRIVIAMQNELPSYYSPVLAASGLPFFDIDGDLAGLEEKGVNPYYWKATGRVGHWNHEAHQWIGQYLAREIAALVTGHNL